MFIIVPITHLFDILALKNKIFDISIHPIGHKKQRISKISEISASEIQRTDRNLLVVHSNKNKYTRTMLLQNLEIFEKAVESQLNLSNLILVSRIKLSFTVNKTFVFRNN